LDAQQAGTVSRTEGRRPFRSRGISASGPMSSWKLDR
jgi:hypothetical protein